MIINVRRSGGFAGEVGQRGTIDTSSFDQSTAARIEQNVANLSNYLKSSEQPVGADLVRWDIEVNDGTGKSRTLTVLEEDPSNLPAPLRELLADL